jgi:subtilisin family serine protease
MARKPSPRGAKRPVGVAAAEFDPKKLDRTLVSLELLEAIRILADAGRFGDAIDVIIDLNLGFPRGRAAARDEVRKWLNDRFGARSPDAQPPADAAKADAVAREWIKELKSQYSQQYVFAAVTPATIQALAAFCVAEKLEKGKSPVYKIWLDHDLKRLANVSIGTVKADAARAAFNADGRGIVWAVADSGIDAGHPHFVRHQNLDNLPLPLMHRDFTNEKEVSEEESDKAACQDLFGHGTHVAGIIGGEIPEDPAPSPGDDADAQGRLTAQNAPAVAFHRERNEKDETITTVTPLTKISGMAPRCKLLSLKILDQNGEGKASSLIAAIEYIQYLNGYGRLLLIQGINISVGYSYKPEWFGCGQSPLCVEIDRLVKTGVCVVVAAGNDGYGFVSSTNTSGAAAGLDVTIADPGNADLAITVGSTHREMPHTYGVSYFSSKGPTGDGRLKPDILAPGEKIISCMSAQTTDDVLQKAKLSRQAVTDAAAAARKGAGLYREDSGTSMAAPHVSGVIAAFLSNRREFIGRPEAVKEIFLSTATDLKRAVYFQGKGLVDLMRAIQSI